MPEFDWVHLTTAENKRKRPEHVCNVCHGKKIKCDLQARSSSGHAKCTYCDANSRDCRARIQKRAKIKETRTRQQPDEAVAAETLQSIRKSQTQQTHDNRQSHVQVNGQPEMSSLNPLSAPQRRNFDTQLGYMNEVSSPEFPIPHAHGPHHGQQQSHITSTAQVSFMPQSHTQQIATPPVQQQYPEHAGPSPGIRSLASNEQAETGEAAHTGDVDTGFL